MWHLYQLRIQPTLTVLSSLKQRQGSLFGTHSDPFSVESETANACQATSQRPLQMAEGVINNNMSSSNNNNTSHRSVFSCLCLGMLKVFSWILKFLHHYWIALYFYCTVLSNFFGQLSICAWVWHWNLLLDLNTTHLLAGYSTFVLFVKHFLSSPISYCHTTQASKPLLDRTKEIFTNPVVNYCQELKMFASLQFLDLECT